MDLSPNAPQEAFRLECRTWLQRELPWDYGVGLPPMFDDLSEEVAFLRDWQENWLEQDWLEFPGRPSTAVGTLTGSITTSSKRNSLGPELQKSSGGSASIWSGPPS